MVGMHKLITVITDMKLYIASPMVTWPMTPCHPKRRQYNAVAKFAPAATNKLI